MPLNPLKKGFAGAAAWAARSAPRPRWNEGGRMLCSTESLRLKLAESYLLYGVGLLIASGVGHCVVIVLAGTFTELVQRFLNWNEQSKGVTSVLPALKRRIAVPAGVC